MSSFATCASSHHEHLQALQSPDDELTFLKTAAAFANSSGGTIFIAPLPFGFSNPKDVTALLRQTDRLLANGLSTSVPYHTTTEAFKDGLAVRIDLFPCTEPPCFLQSTGPIDGTFIRVGAETLLASDTTRRELELRRTNTVWDSSTPAEIAPATNERINRLCELLQDEARKNRPENEASEAISPQTLAIQGLLTQQDDTFLPTRAFLLLEGGSPNAGIRCGLYLGTSDVVIGDLKSFTGPLLEQFHEAENWLLSKLETRQLRDANRTTIPEVPPAAIRAALVSAFCYRSYLQSDEPIDIAVNKTDILITTPGGLPLNFPQESFLDGAAAFRNPAIASALASAGLMEPWKSTVPRARQAMKAWSLPAPLYEQTGSALRITLHRPGDIVIKGARLRDILAFDASHDVEEAPAVDAASTACTERGLRILQLISADAGITTQELMAGLELTEGQVKFELKKLKASGRLAREGTRKGRWRILVDPNTAQEPS